MNYGKQQASKKREKITSKKTMKKKRMGVRFFKAFLLMCLIAIMLGVIGVGALFKKIIDVLRKQSLANGMDVTICGEHNIFQHSEYSDVNNVQKFLSEVGSKDKMAQASKQEST